MNHSQKTNSLITIQVAAQQMNESATRALALITADSFSDSIFGPSIQIQLDSLAKNAQALHDAIKDIEDMKC